jgi:hypothetical protein
MQRRALKVAAPHSPRLSGNYLIHEIAADKVYRTYLVPL